MNLDDAKEMAKNLEPKDIQELTTALLSRYKSAAGAESSKADKEGNIKLADKRFKGVVKATNKQFANDAAKYALRIRKNK